jgi:hypothetical protein
MLSEEIYWCHKEQKCGRRKVYTYDYAITYKWTCCKSQAKSNNHTIHELSKYTCNDKNNSSKRSSQKKLLTSEEQEISENDNWWCIKEQKYGNRKIREYIYKTSYKWSCCKSQTEIPDDHINEKYIKTQLYDHCDEYKNKLTRCGSQEKNPEHYAKYDLLKQTHNKSINKELSNGEKYCNEIIEELFPDYKFDKVRPKWLKNPKTNRSLELDLYNCELKIAIEYNGRQHYEYVKRFHHNEEEFADQLKRDLIKRQVCEARNINLICVPHTCKTKKQIRNYLCGQLGFN